MSLVTRQMMSQIKELSGGEVAARVIYHKVFDSVRNKKDWKAPIDKTLDMWEWDFEADVILDAIEYMTATKGKAEKTVDGKMHFTADGYRKGPAGDH